MASRYLLESSTTDGYLLEDSSGVYLLDAPTTYYQAVAGTIAATGTVIRKTLKTVVGVFAATGTLNAVKKVFKAVGGTFAAAGNLSKKIIKKLIGLFNSLGTLIAIKGSSIPDTRRWKRTGYHRSLQ